LKLKDPSPDGFKPMIRGQIEPGYVKSIGEKASFKECISEDDA